MNMHANACMKMHALKCTKWNSHACNFACHDFFMHKTLCTDKHMDILSLHLYSVWKVNSIIFSCTALLSILPTHAW